MAQRTVLTNPNNGADFFQLKTVTKTAAGFSVTAAGKAGRSSVLERQTDLGGPWEHIAATPSLLADESVSLTDAAAPSGHACYRLRVSIP